MRYRLRSTKLLSESVPFSYSVVENNDWFHRDDERKMARIEQGELLWRYATLVRLPLSLIDQSGYPIHLSFPINLLLVTSGYGCG